MAYLCEHGRLNNDNINNDDKNSSKIICLEILVCVRQHLHGSRFTNTIRDIWCQKLMPSSRVKPQLEQPNLAEKCNRPQLEQPRFSINSAGTTKFSPSLLMLERQDCHISVACGAWRYLG